MNLLVISCYLWLVIIACNILHWQDIVKNTQENKHDVHLWINLFTWKNFHIYLATMFQSKVFQQAMSATFSSWILLLGEVLGLSINFASTLWQEYTPSLICLRQYIVRQDCKPLQRFFILHKSFRLTSGNQKVTIWLSGNDPWCIRDI